MQIRKFNSTRQIMQAIVDGELLVYKGFVSSSLVRLDADGFVYSCTIGSEKWSRNSYKFSEPNDWLYAEDYLKQLAEKDKQKKSPSSLASAAVLFDFDDDIK